MENPVATVEEESVNNGAIPQVYSSECNTLDQNCVEENGKTVNSYPDSVDANNSVESESCANTELSEVPSENLDTNTIVETEYVQSREVVYETPVDKIQSCHSDALETEINIEETQSGNIESSQTSYNVEEVTMECNVENSALEPQTEYEKIESPENQLYIVTKDCEDTSETNDSFTGNKVSQEQLVDDNSIQENTNSDSVNKDSQSECETVQQDSIVEEAPFYQEDAGPQSDSFQQEMIETEEIIEKETVHQQSNEMVQQEVTQELEEAHEVDEVVHIEEDVSYDKEDFLQQKESVLQECSPDVDDENDVEQTEAVPQEVTPQEAEIEPLEDVPVPDQESSYGVQTNVKAEIDTELNNFDNSNSELSNVENTANIEGNTSLGSNVVVDYPDVDSKENLVIETVEVTDIEGEGTSEDVSDDVAIIEEPAEAQRTPGEGDIPVKLNDEIEVTVLKDKKGDHVTEEIEITEVIEGESNSVNEPIEFAVVGKDNTVKILNSSQAAKHYADTQNVVLIEQFNSGPAIIHMNQMVPLENSDLDSDQVYLDDFRNVNTNVKTNVPTPKRRGRKPATEIPLHVLGRDISSPVHEIRNGKSLPKPRLGVKVPSINLTSQIVSKAEIQKEIIDRALIKQEQIAASGDVIFAKKLTQRLARKIAPEPPANEVKSSDTSDQPSNNNTDIKPPEKPRKPAEDQNKQVEKPGKPAGKQVSESIENNSDLLAILEGEGEDLPLQLPKEVSPEVVEMQLKQLEREIALQQLQELPRLTPKSRIFKGRVPVEPGSIPILNIKQEIKLPSKMVAQDSSQIKKQKIPSKMVAQESLQVRKQTSSSAVKKHSDPMSPNPKKQIVDIEPQVKINMVLKTYSRKRKSTEVSEPLPELVSEKKPLLEIKEEKPSKAQSPAPATPDVYITKSSRVIKKKVIWDPDDDMSRSPKPIRFHETPAKTKVLEIKPSSSVKTVAAAKAAEKKVINEKTTEKKSTEKVPDKKAVEDKVLSRKINEKPVIITTKKHTMKKEDKSPKNKKRLTEIDRLLMDEGAVNMLYDVKNVEEPNEPKKKKSVISIDRAHKELMKKTNEIKSELQQTSNKESPKSLRKKEGPSLVKTAIPAAILRKKSKDSPRGSIHTPPASPAVYARDTEMSRIIRRRSSSSISSGDEADVDEDHVERPVKKKSSSSDDGPKPKKFKKSHEVTAFVEKSTRNIESSEKKLTEKAAKTSHCSVINKLSQCKSFTVKKLNKLITLDLNYINEECYCTVQVLKELTESLKILAKDKECSVVCITSSSKAFCSGLDYRSLVIESEDTRKKKATDLASFVRDFLLCLLKFPKVLIAGIKGDCVGLGVTMLPLFDMVIASDTATFSTPYADLGCMAEGGFLLRVPYVTSHGLAAELLYTTQKLKADDASRRGLVTKLCWPEKYHDEMKSMLNALSKGSKQSLEATKKQLRGHLQEEAESAINSDTKVLVEHWISPECQKNFSNVLADRNDKK